MYFLAAVSIAIENKTNKDLNVFILPLKDIGQHSMIKQNPLFNQKIPANREGFYKLMAWQENFDLYAINIGKDLNSFMTWVMPLKAIKQFKILEEDGLLKLWANYLNSDWREITPQI